MPDAPRLRTTTAAPANALLRCTAVLAGWLWLGFEGMHLGWPLAGGLGVVALWWALRLLCGRWAALAQRLGAHAGALSLATGAGVLLVQWAGWGKAGLGALLATAVAWALWTTALGAPVRASRAPRSGPPPVSAAAAGLSATTMGLMMGTLWLSSQWCASTLWPAPAMMALHVALMALLPTLLRRPASALRAHALGRDGLPLALLAAGGACVLATDSPGGWMIGMALQALAWGLANADQTAPDTHWQGVTLALTGPVLLALVGHFSPTAGPLALHAAQALVGALALGALLFRWRETARRTITLPPSSTRMDTP